MPQTDYCLGHFILWALSCGEIVGRKYNCRTQPTRYKELPQNILPGCLVLGSIN